MHKHFPTIVALIGFSLAVIGFIFDWCVVPMIIEKAKKSMVIDEYSSNYHLWKNPPFPTKLKVYFFHVLNPEEVQSGANPVVQERGPYIYDEYREKHSVFFNKSEGTVTYLSKRMIFFNSKESGCRSENDEVTIINPSIVGTSLQVEGIMPAALSMLNDAIPYLFKGATDAFLRIRVRDILFDGIKISCQDAEVAMICSGIKGSSPISIKSDSNGDFRFSMMNHLNNTDFGPYEVYTGSRDLLETGIHKSYTGSSSVGKWMGDTCNSINGTDGFSFPPGMKQKDKIYVFTPEICRSLFLRFNKVHSLHGVSAYRYRLSQDLFGRNHENECFCKPALDDDQPPNCPPDGTIDLQPCYKGPILLSNPHFLYADKKLQEYVTGVKPTVDEHSSFVDIEPFTGVPLRGQYKFQWNVYLKRFDAIDVLTNVSEGVFPIVWTDQGRQLPEYLIEQIRAGHRNMKILHCIKWVFLVLGITIMLASSILILFIERLLCFSQINKVSINRARPIETVSNSSIDKEGLNPNLYPQIENKNMAISNLRLYQVNNLGGPIEYKF